MARTIQQISFPAPMRPSLKRVAAYARVSSGKDAMLHSLSAQVSYYSSLIQKHTGWLYCGVYADEAFTGTKDSRDGFQSLLAECRAGNIDMVITKSISRFARNTVTLLETVRELKTLGVDVYFEEQNIHTISTDGELMMTILASYAQEESRSASENQKWRIRRGFERGELVNLRFLFGYKIEKGRVTVDPEKAAVVREVFRRALEGESLTSLAIDLNRRGFTGVLGGKWNSVRIREMLSNEKYLGNALLQKQYRNNHLEKKEIPNRGELPQYYAEGTHEAIIDRGTFDFVQQEMARRRALGARANKSLNISCFTGVIKCACHGCSFVHSARRNRAKDPAYHTGTVVYWNCGMTKKKGGHCATKAIPEQKLKAFCADAMGLPAFDETVFTERIERITISGQRHVEIAFRDGTTKEFDWVSTGHQECWTPEARERKRQMMLERWAKQKCQR